MELAGIIIGLVTALCTTGGIIYLVVEKLFDRRRDNVEVKRQEVENVKETIEYGIPMITIYEEIRKIVVKETTPIQEKLDKALERIDDLENNYCCYRPECDFRLRSKKDIEFAEHIESVAHETVKRSCKAK